MSGAVIRQGYLHKSPPKPDSFVKGWQKRWCVLYESHMLKYFSDQSAFKKREDPKGYVNLNDCERIDTNVPQEIARKRKHGHLFTVKTPNRVYYFVAQSGDDRRGWIEDISRLIGVTPLSGENPEKAQRVEPPAEPATGDALPAAPVPDITAPVPVPQPVETRPVSPDPVVPVIDRSFKPPIIDRMAKPAPMIDRTSKPPGSLGTPTRMYGTLEQCPASRTLPMPGRVPIPPAAEASHSLTLREQRYHTPLGVPRSNYAIPPRPSDELYKVPSSLPAHVSGRGTEPGAKRRSIPVNYTEVEVIRDPNGSNRGSIVDFPPSRRRSDEPRTQYTQIDIGRTMRDAELQEDEMYIGMQNGVCGEYYSVMKPQLAEEEIYDSGVSGPAANGYPPAHLESRLRGLPGGNY
ncbi:GRB2-associated-binding protein 1-like [Oscarella lobularis]|uniref:GRB2-associated-binding protein 1-like n=1 Tax=Oscarella lobularis TaxID=121494 RepID=UPI0033143528